MKASGRAIVVMILATGLACGGKETPALDTTASPPVAVPSDTASVSALDSPTASSRTAVTSADTKSGATRSPREPVATTPRPDAVPQPAQQLPPAQPAEAPTPRADTAKPATPVVAPATPSTGLDLAAGKAAYEANCRKCHGARGVPPRAMQTKFPKLEVFDAAFFAKRSPDSVVAVLTKGSSADMKSYRDKLSLAEMRAVDAYMRTFAP